MHFEARLSFYGKSIVLGVIIFIFILFMKLPNSVKRFTPLGNGYLFYIAVANKYTNL